MIEQESHYIDFHPGRAGRRQSDSQKASIMISDVMILVGLGMIGIGVYMWLGIGPALTTEGFLFLGGGISLNMGGK